MRSRHSLQVATATRHFEHGVPSEDFIKHSDSRTTKLYDTGVPVSVGKVSRNRKGSSPEMDEDVLRHK